MEVKILDLNTFKPWEFKKDYLEDLVLQEISNFKPVLIGFGCIFSGVFPFVLKASNRIRKTFREIPIVVGGIHVSVFPKEILTHWPAIDYIVIGEGEEQLVSLASSIEKNDHNILSKINGIAYRKNNRVVINPKTKYIDNLDDFLPAYDLINFGEYCHPVDHWHNPKRLNFKMSVPLVSSRSCPIRCNFCSMFLVMGPNIRVRSAKHVVDEMLMLNEQFHQNHFTFVDDNINIKKDHISSICREITERKLNIQFEISNGLSIAPLTKEIIDLMVEAGWVRGGVGIESGSDFIRNKVVGKGLSKKNIFEIIKVIKSYRNRIYLKAWFIIGFPEETPETLTDTYDMIKEIQVDEADVINLMPYPGTRVFNQCLRDNLFIKEIDQRNLWKMTGFQMHNNEKFYIKPYKMEIKELEEFREKFDELLEGMNKFGRNPAAGKI